MKYRQLLVSLTGFALVVGGLAYVDPRVRDQLRSPRVWTATASRPGTTD